LLKTIYKDDGERDRALISGGAINSFVGKHINGNRPCFAVQSNQNIDIQLDRNNISQ